jgi:uncharacterized protein (DUF2141 family)
MNHLRKMRGCAALAILLVCGPIACAQSDEKAAEASAKGTITGRVVNESGQPLPNALVNIRGYDGSGGRTVNTDAEGNFQAADLPPIAYLISAFVPGYVPRPRDPDLNPIGYYRIGDSARIEMVKGGVITGAVKRSNGEPVVLVTMRAYMTRDSKGQPVRYATPSRMHTTDDRGIYRIYGLPPGTYIVAASGGTVNGYSLDPFAGDAPTYAPSGTRDTASEITINAGEEATLDIRYRDEPGHVVSGTATGSLADDPQRGFSIALNSRFNGIEQAAYSTWGARSFMFSGVADGDYDIVAQNYSPDAGWAISETRRIKVNGGDLTGIALTLKPLASMSGTVVLEDSKVAECQGKRRPVFGEIVVGAYHNEKNAAKDQPQFIWGLGGPLTPDKQGNFTLRNLAAGQYRFVTRPLAKYWYLKSISWPGSGAKAAETNQPADAASHWTTIKASDKYSGLTITFAAGAASIHGRVEAEPGGKLSPRVFVYLTPAEPEKREDILRYFVSLAAEDGTFELGSIPPGRYWVNARAAAEGDTNMQTKIRLPDETELRAKIVHDGEAGKNKAELKPCQNLTEYRLPFRE